MGPDTIERASARLMGCDTTVMAPAGYADQALTRLRTLESYWSRFRSDSDVSRLNAAAGRPVAIHRDTHVLLHRLALAHRLTDGAFDPTLLGTIVGLGYDASVDDRTSRTSLHPSARHSADPSQVLIAEIDGATTAMLPPGTAIDPGGLGKGLAADIVVAELVAAGASGAMVEIGGDLRVAGEPLGGEVWAIDIHDPARSSVIDRIAISDGGVATSSTRLRTWQHAGTSVHHLIDPTLGAPSERGVAGCTVAAGDAAWAEALTKVPFARSVDATRAFFEQHNVAALIVFDDGRQHATSAWKDLSR